MPELVCVQHRTRRSIRRSTLSRRCTLQFYPRPLTCHPQLAQHVARPFDVRHRHRRQAGVGQQHLPRAAARLADEVCQRLQLLVDGCAVMERRGRGNGRKQWLNSKQQEELLSGGQPIGTSTRCSVPSPSPQHLGRVPHQLCRLGPYA